MKIKPDDWVTTDIFYQGAYIDVSTSWMDLFGEWKYKTITYLVQYSLSRNQLRLRYNYPKYAKKYKTYYRAIAALELHKMQRSILRDKVKEGKLVTIIW